MFQPTFPDNKFRAVFFDFDGTLRFNDPLAHRFFFDFAVYLGAADSDENRRTASRWAHQYWNGKGEVVSDSECYGYDTNEFWLNYARKYLLAFNCPPAQAEAFAPQLRWHMDTMYEPVSIIDPETPRLLGDLREAGFLLAVVSNRDEPYNELLDTLGLAPYFEYTLAAGEVNSWKPDTLIFEHALEKTGLEASETLYVGDNYFADVVGARRAGLEPVLIDPEGVFPDADCAVIKSITELRSLIVHRPNG